jgi:hypothetical protein
MAARLFSLPWLKSAWVGDALSPLSRDLSIAWNPSAGAGRRNADNRGDGTAGGAAVAAADPLTAYRAETPSSVSCPAVAKGMYRCSAPLPPAWGKRTQALSSVGSTTWCSPTARVRGVTDVQSSGWVPGPVLSLQPASAATTTTR